MNLLRPNSRIRALLHPAGSPIYALALLILALCLILLLIAPLRINHDVALFLIMGDMLLDGAVPYVDYVTINFPMAQYVYLPAVALARILPINPIPIFNLGVFLLTVVAMGVIGYLLVKKHVPALNYFAASVLLGIALLTLHLIAIGDYGQREHLMFLLILPGVILRWLRWQGQVSPPIWLAVLIGIMAGIGANIKPHFLLLPITVEGFALLRYRRLRPFLTPETEAFAVVITLYALHFFLVPSAMREGFIYIIQEASLHYNTTYGVHTLPELLLVPTGSLAILLVPLLLAPRPQLHEWSLLQMFSIMGLAGIFIFAYQLQGFPYHLIPTYAPALLIVVTGVMQALYPQAAGEPSEASGLLRPFPEYLPVAVATLIIVLLFGLWSGITASFIPQIRAENSSSMTEFIKQHTSPGDYVYMGTNYELAFKPIVQAGRKMAGRDFSPLALMWSDLSTPNVSLTTLDSSTSDKLKRYLDGVKQDIRRNEPTLILLHNRPGACFQCPFAVAEFLMSHGLREDVLMPNYVQLDNFGDYIVFKRSMPPNTPMESPIRFGDHLLLTAWDIVGRNDVQTCSPMTFRSLWKTDGPIEGILSISVVLAAPDGGGIASMDGPPADYPPMHWVEGVPYLDERMLQIPCDLLPGEYSLLITAYLLYVSPDAEQLAASYPDGTVIGEYFYVTTIVVRK